MMPEWGLDGIGDELLKGGESLHRLDCDCGNLHAWRCGVRPSCAAGPGPSEWKKTETA